MGFPGPQGDAGPIGPVGPQGPQGPKGETGTCEPCVFIGSAYGATAGDGSLTPLPTTLYAKDLTTSSSDISPYLAPLIHGTPLINPDTPFYFAFYHDISANGYRGYYHIQENGRYLLQYGLTAEIDNNLRTGLSPANPDSAVAIQIRINHGGDFNNADRIGAIPLSLTHTLPSSQVNLPPPATVVNNMVCGFGQISLDLTSNDDVFLEIFVGSKDPYTVGVGNVIIQPTSITHYYNPLYTPTGFTTSNIARGPTLTITRIGEAGQGDTPQIPNP